MRVRDNLQLWSESFGANLVPGEIFEIQSQIAERVASSIDETLGNRVVPREEPTLDAGAYENYLLGRYYWNRRTAESLQKAAAYFEKAIELDADFVRAYAGLADALALYPFYNLPENLQRGALTKAEEMARQAVALDPELGEAHASLAFAVMYGRWGWEVAERHFLRSLKLAPDYAVGHYWYAELLSCTGRYAEALDQAHTAVQLEPAMPVARQLYAVGLLFNGRIEEAEEEARHALSLEPNFTLPRYVLSQIHLVRGNFAGWQAEMTTLGIPREITDLIRSARRGEVDPLVASQQLEAFANSADPRRSQINQAGMHCLAGSLDAAMSHLEKSADAREPAVLLIPAWAEFIAPFSTLAAHPRWPALLERIRTGSAEPAPKPDAGPVH